MRGLVALCGAAVASSIATACPVNAEAAHQPPAPDGVTIGTVTANGSGCPDGTAAVNMAPDNSAFTVTYSHYTAQAGAGIPSTNARKNCQINFQVLIPQGFTYAVTKADYRGYASLPSGAVAMERAGYYFGGYSSTLDRRHHLRGPYNDDWQFTDTTPWAALVFHRCGDNPIFNINTELRTTASPIHPAVSSIMTMDSTDAGLHTVYHLAWKRCS